MGVIPQHEINAVKGMVGYEQMLEIDRLCKLYQVDEASIRNAISSGPGQGPPQSTHMASYAQSSHGLGVGHILRTKQHIAQS